ncbi:MAG: protein jag [Epsilonproteobacteria bacterium]|nr:protein jag [Campylobacterota bacterium]
MSLKIEAKTLEEAFKKASQELGCSVTELEVKILQHPSKGLLGIGKKNAIILVDRKRRKEPLFQFTRPKVEEEELKIFENFYKESKDIDQIAKEVQKELNALFSHLCFKLDEIKVTPYDRETLLIEFEGEDAALLIGKEGYRYKALSYMLFNWINPKYNLQIRLEIAEFLKSQEEMIKHYLAPLVDKVKKEGKGQTKPLDGVLIQIALKYLRETFPNKYVAPKENKKGQKYIVINEFRRY